MSEIRLEEILKIFPFTEVKGVFSRAKRKAALEKQKAMPYITNEGVVVLQHISAEIKQGEFVVLLGPSGCGKTTLLRIIAGLEEPTLGDVYFDGKCVTELPPEDRDVAMVFQNYSLYPHLTVFDNIAFTLRTQHMPREELENTVNEMARLLGIAQCLDRLPSQLSGGQLQRVAIARALVRKPEVFLMDEPFSNLDAPLRAALRNLIKKIHAELGTTFIYVTHDQNEALALGKRIIVMHDGIIEQNDTPQKIYNRPANSYVAVNVGSPQMNLFDKVPVQNGIAKFLGCDIPLPGGRGAKNITIGIRPVHIERDDSGIEAQVIFAEPLGAETLVHLTAQGQKFDALLETSVGETFFRGQKINIRLPQSKLHFFDESGIRIE